MAACCRLSSTPAVQLRAAAGQPVEPHAVGDVLEDRLGKRVRLLEHHPDAPAQPDDVDARRVDVLAVDLDVSLDARARDDVVHPVERAQERALAAARRPDERRDQVRRDVDRDCLERPLGAVVEVQVP